MHQTGSMKAASPPSTGRSTRHNSMWRHRDRFTFYQRSRRVPPSMSSITRNRCLPSLPVTGPRPRAVAPARQPHVFQSKAVKKHIIARANGYLLAVSGESTSGFEANASVRR